MGHQVYILCRLDVGDEFAELGENEFRVGCCWLRRSEETRIEEVGGRKIAEGLGGVVEIVWRD